jgi:hypothetical protein
MLERWSKGREAALLECALWVFFEGWEEHGVRHGAGALAMGW